MSALKLYAPALVLVAMAAISAVGVSLASIWLLILAAAVWLHIRAERDALERKR